MVSSNPLPLFFFLCVRLRWMNQVGAPVRNTLASTFHLPFCAANSQAQDPSTAQAQQELPNWEPPLQSACLVWPCSSISFLSPYQLYKARLATSYFTAFQSLKSSPKVTLSRKDPMKVTVSISHEQ